MKIVRLTAENIKRLKAVTIEPQGSTVVISGKNGQGKTSVLDAIWFALGGGDATKGTVRPIRDGQQTASVTLDLGEYTVTRSWTANDKSYLKVENKDGARFPSPQAMLDKLVGKLSFDPLAFAQMDSRSQLAALMDVVELEEDPAELDAKREALFNERTQVNRRVRQLEGQLAGMPEPAAGLPLTEVSAASVMAEAEKAAAQVRANDQKRSEATSAQKAVYASDAQVAAFRMEVEAAEKRLAMMRESLEKAQAELGKRQIEKEQLACEATALSDPDLSVYHQRLAEVERTNHRVRAAHVRMEVAGKLAEVKGEGDRLSTAITAIDARKAEVVRNAKMPVEGLGFDAGGVTYNGIPFRQCSSAEQLRVSMAMAMEVNPRLRVIRITDGSLLDSDNMRVIEDMANQRDFQVWIERVDETGKVGVYIEDGEVRQAQQDSLFGGCDA